MDEGITMAVYVIGPTGGPYKIGTTTQSVEKRLANLQTGSPVDLHIVMQGEGGRELEGQLHDKFKYCAIRGEWFNLLEDDLKSLEEILSSDYPSSGLESFEQTVTIKQLTIGKKALTPKFILQLPEGDIREIGGILWGWWFESSCYACTRRTHIHFLFEKEGVLYRQAALSSRPAQYPGYHALTPDQWDKVVASGQIFL